MTITFLSVVLLVNILLFGVTAIGAFMCAGDSNRSDPGSDFMGGLVMLLVLILNTLCLLG